jgi:hypothetical protein
MLVVRRVATKLFATENAVDVALADATDLMADMIRARKDLNLAATSSDPSIAKVAAAITAMAEARTAMVEAHGELNELKLRMGIRTKLDGGESKVEEMPVTTGLRNVA